MRAVKRASLNLLCTSALRLVGLGVLDLMKNVYIAQVLPLKDEGLAH